MSEDVAAGEPSQAPTPKRNWGVWGVWFGVALLLWAVSFAEEYLVVPPSFAPRPLGYIVASQISFFVLYLVLVPFAGYFVQQRLKSFDLMGIFVMTLAAGFLVGMVPMTITQGCIRLPPYLANASGTCSYQLDLSMPFIQSLIQNNTVGALENALNVSLVMLAGAFLSQWRRGALTIASPARSKSFLLAAWLVIGFVAVGAGSVAIDYLLYPPGNFPPWYTDLAQLLSGPVLAFCLGFLLYGRPHEVGMKQLFSMVALGGILASVITQVAQRTALAQMESSVIVTLTIGTYAAWIVLSGCLLSVFEKKNNIALKWLTKIFVPVGGPDISEFEHDTISYGWLWSVSANFLASIVSLYGVQRGLVHESNPLEVWTFASTFNFFISTVLHVLLIATPFLLANFFVHRFEKRRRRRGKSKPRNPNTTADFLLIIALWLVIGLTFIDCIRDIVIVLL